MATSRERLLKEALSLPPVDRAQLIEDLFLSFHSGSRALRDKLWGEEAERRIEAFEDGKIQSKSADEVFKNIK
jgi:putative addiction module component (TIGR02574 family)